MAKGSSGGLSLNPNSFSEDGGLLDMTLEQAFHLYHARNKNTSKEDKIKPVLIHCRQVMRGSILCMKLLAKRNGASLAEFSLCTSFKVLTELQAVGIVSRLSKSYAEILESGIRNVLFDELSVLTSGYNITYRDSRAQGWFPVYPEVHTALSSVADGCGADVPRLYQVGLSLALSRSEEAVEGGILFRASEEIYRPEALSFLRYMAKWHETLDIGLFGRKND